MILLMYLFKQGKPYLYTGAQSADPYINNNSINGINNHPDKRGGDPRESYDHGLIHIYHI